MEPTPTATVIPPKILTICTAALPASLFPYDGVRSRVKENILEMLYPVPIDQVRDGFETQILSQVPSQATGSLRLEAVEVEGGQLVMDARGDVVVLKPGIRVRPSGCRQAECAVAWDGSSPLQMDQMVVTYQLADGLTWSDGTPVGASDSVFSYSLENAMEAQVTNWAVERTADYFAVDAQTVQWIGKPGFTTSETARFFWRPLPSHLFADQPDWVAIRHDERLASAPISYGPFVLASWDATAMRFERNPHYSLSGEGYPVLDIVDLRVVNGGAEEGWIALQSGNCDILDTSFGLQNNPGLLNEISADTRFNLQAEMSDAWIQLVFGIQPAAYDDYYNPYVGDRPDFFGDPLVRQAFAACLDRQAMLDQTMDLPGELWPSFLPPWLSQLSPNEGITHDPALGISYLEEAGWRDHDGDLATPLQAWYVSSIPVGTLFDVELLVSSSAFHQELGRIVQESLGACGIGVTVTALPAADLFSPGPEGLIFGRAFDLALIVWQPMDELDCGFYQSCQIPSEANQWIGTNVAGLSNAAYDDACSAAALALPDEYKSALLDAEQTFVGTLLAIPLFSLPGVMVTPAMGWFESRIISEDGLFSQLEFIEWDDSFP